MQITLKRIDVGSAFRVGMIVYGLVFAIFGLVFVALQGVFLNAITRSVSLDVPSVPNGTAIILGTGVLSLLCFYGVGVVVAAIFGGIQFAVGAFCYNRAANWVGGLKLELETGDSAFLDDIEGDLSKRKRDSL